MIARHSHASREREREKERRDREGGKKEKVDRGFVRFTVIIIPKNLESNPLDIDDGPPFSCI